MSVQKVKVTCTQCGFEDARLAGAIKKGKRTRCASCKKTFVVERVEPLIGTSGS
jgi:transposase-like protein